MAATEVQLNGTLVAGGVNGTFVTTPPATKVSMKSKIAMKEKREQQRAEIAAQEEARPFQMNGDVPELKPLEKVGTRHVEHVLTYLPMPGDVLGLCSQDNDDPKHNRSS